MSLPWDPFRAELADTMRGNKDARPKRPCVYCSQPTRALSGVCLAHEDLIDFDAGYPAALDETETNPPPVTPGSLPSRSRRTQSAGEEPDGGSWANGERVTVSSALVQPGSSPAEPLEAI